MTAVQRKIAPRRVVVFMAAAAVALLSLARPSLGQTVTLLGAARIDPSGPVLLGDIAHIEGEGAEALAGVVIVEDPARELALSNGPLMVRLDRVRESIERSGKARRSTLALQGRSCVIVPIRRVEAGPSLEKVEEDKPDPSHLGRPTVRGGIERYLLDIFGVRPSEARFSFEDRDEAFLAETTIGRHMAVRRVGSSARVPVAVTVYDGESIVASGTVRVTVLLKRDVLVATRPVSRGVRLDSGVVRAETRWVPPTIDPAPADEAIGSVLVDPRVEGQIVERRNLEPPVMVRRGDIVKIHCVAGTVVIELDARARTDGREGDVIEFEPMDGTRRRINARVSGPGQAVVNAR